MNNHPFKTFLLHRNRAPYIILTTEEKCSKFKFMLVEKKMIFSSTDMQLGAKTASFWTIISYNFVSQKGLCYIRVFLCPFSFVSNQHPEQQKKNFSKNNKTEYPDEDALQKTDRKRTKVALWSHKWAEMIQFWVFSLFDAKFSVIFYHFSLNGVPQLGHGTCRGDTYSQRRDASRNIQPTVIICIDDAGLHLSAQAWT